MTSSSGSHSLWQLTGAQYVFIGNKECLALHSLAALLTEFCNKDDNNGWRMLAVYIIIIRPLVQPALQGVNCIARASENNFVVVTIVNKWPNKDHGVAMWYS